MIHSIRVIIVLALLIPFAGCTFDNKSESSSNEEQIDIVVNPTIELFGRIHYLVGDNQYTENLLPDYYAEVENNFGQFSSHPTIDFFKACKIQHQINGDAPMALAVYIGPPPKLEPKLDLSNLPADLDPRWDSTLISDYLEHARRFAVESNYMDFHKRQKDFHLAAMYNLKEMLSREQIFAWYA